MNEPQLFTIGHSNHATDQFEKSFHEASRKA